MMAASNELADEMNDAIRSDLQHLGVVQAGGPERRADERRTGGRG